MKLYVVSKGEYSDWMMVGIFSTREKAELYMQTFRQQYGG